jgi:hypothetical protein
MKTYRSDNRARLVGLPLLLLIMALVGAACAPTAPAPALPPASPSAPTAAPAAPATQPAASPSSTVTSAVGSDKQWSQDPAPSVAKNPAAANTRHYQGDPNAPVVIIEASDFQ